MPDKRRWTLGVVPISVLYGLFFVVPLLLFLTVSLRETAGLAQIGPGPTLENFQRVLGDPYYLSLIWDTLRLALITALASILLAYPIAYVVARGSRVWRQTVFLLVIGSMFTSFIVGALGLRILVADSGPVNTVLQAIGLVGEPLRLANSEFAVVMGMVHSMVPLAVLSLIPACEAIPEEQLQAAYGLGASHWYTFWRVIFAHNRVALASVGLVIFAIASGLFVTPLLLGGGQVRVIGIEIRQQILGLLDYPLGATLATMLLILVSILVGVSLYLSRKFAVRGGSL